MKGWIQLCSDVNWVDYHGMWAKRAKDGSWYVLRWTNLEDACGAADTPYECEVKRVDLADISDEAITSALRSCGLRREGEELVFDSGDTIAPSHTQYALVECCVSHGLGNPLETFTGDKYPERIQARARRYAEECMR